MHKQYPFFAAYDKGNPIGFIALKLHNAYTAEVHVIGVVESWHSKGVGTKLLQAAIDYLRQENYSFLTVKTLDASAAYVPYDSTRQFYLNRGFAPLEVFEEHWDKDNPCLLMLKVL